MRCRRFDNISPISSLAFTTHHVRSVWEFSDKRGHQRLSTDLELLKIQKASPKSKDVREKQPPIKKKNRKIKKIEKEYGRLKMNSRLKTEMKVECKRI